MSFLRKRKRSFRQSQAPRQILRIIRPTAVIVAGNAELSLGWANVERLRCSLIYVNGYEELHFLFKNPHIYSEREKNQDETSQNKFCITVWEERGKLV